MSIYGTVTARYDYSWLKRWNQRWVVRPLIDSICIWTITFFMGYVQKWTFYGLKWNVECFSWFYFHLYGPQMWPTLCCILLYQHTFHVLSRLRWEVKHLIQVGKFTEQYYCTIWKPLINCFRLHPLLGSALYIYGFSKTPTCWSK